MMDEQQRREALFETVRELVPQDEPPATPVPPPHRTGLAVTLLAISWLLLGYIWLARPAWIFGPNTDIVLPAARREAALRFTLYLQRSRINEFAERYGRPPVTLTDAGPVLEGVTWQRDGTGYLLTGELQGQTLRLSGAMNADSFLGNSLEVLRR